MNLTSIGTSPAKEYSNVIPWEIIIGTKKVHEKKYNKDGSEKKTHCNKKAGVSSEVFAFRTKEELDAVYNVLDKRIAEATNSHHEEIRYRNKLLFTIGINVGIRASDLRKLQWNFFLEEENGELKFKEYYSIKPKKTERCGKFVKLYFNDTVKQVIRKHIKQYPIKDLNDYLFKSREGNDAITVAMVWHILNSVAKDAGIKQNIGSHSLRKTFGFWHYHEATDKSSTLVTLQKLFNHDSTSDTLKYIGILDDEIKDEFNNVQLGTDRI